MTIQNTEAFRRIKQHYYDQNHNITHQRYHPESKTTPLLTIECTDCDTTLFRYNPEITEIKEAIENDRYHPAQKLYKHQDCSTVMACYGSFSLLHNVAVECRDHHLVLFDIEP